MNQCRFYGSSKEIPWDTLESPSGKGSIVYNAHPYHTKLSFSICKKIISQLSKKNEIILDPFCGSGMVGVAAILERRNVILNDLSPYATHIAQGLTTRAQPIKVKKATEKVITSVREKTGSLYYTVVRDSKKEIEASYLIWSDYVLCSKCKHKFLLWDEAINKNGLVRSEFDCPKCHVHIDKKNLQREAGVPVEIVFWNGGKHQYREKPNKEDIEKAIMPSVEKQPWLPPDTMLHIEPGEKWGEQWRKGYHGEITHVKDFFSKRNWIILGFLWEEIQKVEDANIRVLLKLGFTGTMVNVSRMVRYTPSRGGRSNTPGTLYCPSIWLEQNPLLVFNRRMRSINRLVKQTSKSSNYVKVYTKNASNLSNIESNSIDLIVTDPPFGANIQYAELNFIPEAWLQEFTDIHYEAVENPFRKQDRAHYMKLLEGSLHEMYRVLKAGRYAAFFFNTTDSTLWLSLKNSFKNAGFTITKSVPALKGHAGWNQVRNKETVVGWDPIIFLWKSNGQSKLFENYKERVRSNEEFIQYELKKCTGHEQYPYQLLYSKYVSEWFRDGIKDELLDMKKFVKIAKGIL